jgi:hypothetical protein
VPRTSFHRTPLQFPLAPPPTLHRMCLGEVFHHVCYPSISIILLEALSHHFLSNPISFTMMDSAGIVFNESVLVKIFTHYLIMFSFLVSTSTAGTRHLSRPFSSRTKCMLQESTGLTNSFCAPTCVARVHPVTVIHPPAYTYVSEA